MNRTMIIGNLTNDPQLRSITVPATGEILPVCNFSVAVNERRSNGEEKTTYFRVTAWRGLGTACSTYLAKGKKVMVDGAIGVSTYQGQDGAWHSSLELRANSVEFLSSSQRATEAVPAQPQQAAQPERQLVAAQATPAPQQATTEPFPEIPDLPF